MGYVEKELKRLSGRAIHRHRMIREGEHVLAAVSGGKDSLALLWLLRNRLKWIPIDYRITAVHVDPGFGTDSGERIEDYLSGHGFEVITIKSDIGPRAHGPSNRENPCFLCSRLRRKLIFEKAGEIGADKVALGHHKDDLIETFFLNIFYSASISTMLPVQELFDGRLTLIRPLYLVDEGLLNRYAKRMEWPTIDLGCPTAGESKRKEIREILQQLYRSNKKIKGNIFHALQNVNPDYLLGSRNGEEKDT